MLSGDRLQALQVSLQTVSPSFEMHLPKRRQMKSFSQKQKKQSVMLITHLVKKWKSTQGMPLRFQQTSKKCSWRQSGVSCNPALTMN